MAEMRGNQARIDAPRNFLHGNQPTEIATLCWSRDY